MTNANATAIHSHLRRVAPAGKNARTSATAVAAAAVACPDGNEKPTMSTSGLERAAAVEPGLQAP